MLPVWIHSAVGVCIARSSLLPVCYSIHRLYRHPASSMRCESCTQTNNFDVQYIFHACDVSLVCCSHGCLSVRALSRTHRTIPQLIKSHFSPQTKRFSVNSKQQTAATALAANRKHISGQFGNAKRNKIWNIRRLAANKIPVPFCQTLLSPLMM